MLSSQKTSLAEKKEIVTYPSRCHRRNPVYLLQVCHQIPLLRRMDSSPWSHELRINVPKIKFDFSAPKILLPDKLSPKPPLPKILEVSREFKKSK